MKTFFLIFGIISISFHCFSQDYILSKDGKTYECEIISIDSVNANFKIMHANQEIITHLALDKIEKITYADELNNATIKPDSIHIKKESGIYNYYHNGQVINKNELSGLLSLNKQAYAEFTNAKNNNAAASVLGFAGGFLVGWPLGTAIGGGEPNWYLAGAGAGLILLSIPISLVAKSNLEDAIDIYNQGLNKTSNIETEVLLGFTPNGVGILVNF